MSPVIADDPVAFTCVLEARRETVDLLARLLLKHAVLALRWFLDNTRVRQLAADNVLGISRIGAITKAALVLLHLEHGRPIPSSYTA